MRYLADEQVGRKLRRGRFCWQNCLAFIQESAGSIPAHVAAFKCKLRKSPGRMRTLS